MTTWTERLAIALPADLIVEANALAQIIDPDSGGQFTFSLDRQINNYITADIPLKEHFYSVVTNRDSDTWQYIIPQLAAEKGLEPPTSETIELLRSSLLIGEEINNE